RHDLPSGHAGEPYSTTIKLAGGVPPYAFSVAPLDALPSGLTLTSDGVLSGIPQEIGAFAFTVIASDASVSAMATSFNLVVTPPGVASPLLSWLDVADVTVIDDGAVGLPYVFRL